jgi:serine/threonine protein kinase
VHRDVSASNMMVSYDGAVKLLDFGIARAASSTHKTQTGTLKGKDAVHVARAVQRAAARSAQRSVSRSA